MIKPFFVLQFVTAALVTTVITITVGKEEAFSFGAGALFAFLNTIFLTIIASRFFAKKSVALSFILIIFKYIFFGAGLYFLVTGGFLKLQWFVVGLCMLVISIFGLVFIHFQQVKRERELNGTL